MKPKIPNAPRRLARETALRVLYTMDIGRQEAGEALADSLASKAETMDESGQAFARVLVEATDRNKGPIDELINRHAPDFPVARQNAVDRNILRLAVAELRYEASDAPPGVVNNEAVELAKKYSTQESGRFVNGVLGAIVRETTPDADLSQAEQTAVAPEYREPNEDEKAETDAE